MPWYYRVKAAINAAMLFLAPTQETDLALLVSAILKKQTLCPSELARAYPTPKKRRVGAPKHDLLHRPKRLWRFTDNERVDASEVQLALVAHTIARLGFPRLLPGKLAFGAPRRPATRFRGPRRCAQNRQRVAKLRRALKGVSRSAG